MRLKSTRAKSTRVKSEARDLMQHGSDCTPYEGVEVTGWPVKTLLRGALVVDDGRVVGAPDSVSSSRARRPGVCKAAISAARRKIHAICPNCEAG
jgi:hypothetical protein